MLRPDTTVLLTDALRPPEGYRVDVAVATTYSLDLTAMLLAPMTFALHEFDTVPGTTSDQDPVALLNAAQRHMGHTTVFCQAGAIHVPSHFSRILTVVEDGIHEVTAPAENAIFHPKIWAVRYVDDDGDHRHRLLVASRNLTLDSSWDSLLVLDEDPDGTIDARPAADAVGALPARCIRPLPEDRAADVADLAGSLAEVRLAAPEPYTTGTLLSFGLTAVEPDWPLPDRVGKVLAIGPFVTGSTLGRILADSRDAVLVSRPETLDRLPARHRTGWDLQVLSPSLDGTDEGQTVAVDEFLVESTGVDDRDAEDDAGLPLSGLHAKIVIADTVSGDSVTVTGSANLTQAAWHRNVEFGAVLVGPTADCGVDAVLEERAGSPGLRQVMQPYTPRDGIEPDSPAEATAWEIERFHQALARSQPRLDVVAGDDGTVSARLDLLVPDDAPGATTIWLVTVPHRPTDLLGDRIWRLAPENVTPFIAVRTTAGRGDARVTRSCCVMASIAGDVSDRRRAAIAEILDSPERMVRYLALLLGIDARIDDVSADERSGESSVPLGEDGSPESRSAPPVVLYEPLVRAAGESAGHLASIADQIAELRALPDTARLIPPEFEQMWDAVLSTVMSRRHR